MVLPVVIVLIILKKFIQMNELNFDSYLKIFKSCPLNALAMNRSFLEKYGIKLTNKKIKCKV